MNRKNILSKLLLIFFVFLFVASNFVPLVSNGAYFSYTSSKDIINNITLHPQKTGFLKLDERVASLVASFKSGSSSTYETLLKAYDWLVYNVKYGSYKPEYPYYDFSSHYKSPVPYYVVYMAYNPLFCGEGVCDNFSSAFCVLARAIGLEVYTCTGTQIAGGTTYSHVWCEMYLNGETYVFDPQADNSVYASGRGNNRYYFCRPYSNLGNTFYYYGSKNGAMKASFTSYANNTQKEYSYVTYAIGGKGTVTTSQIAQSTAQGVARSQLWSGGNYYYQFSGWLADTNIASNGTNVTLTAKPNPGNTFIGWYVNNTLVSTSTTYIFTVSTDTVVEALFSGQRFNDVSSSSWYYDNVYYCLNAGLMSGTSITSFSPNTSMTRAMMVTILAKMKGANVSNYTTSSFSDVSINSWYGKYVEWAKQNGIVSGTGNNTFSPSATLTREQMVTMLYNFSRYCGYGVNVQKSLAGFVDSYQISSWAKTAMEWAYAKGLLSGTSASTISPKKVATRAECATIVKNFRQA